MLYISQNDLLNPIKRLPYYLNDATNGPQKTPFGDYVGQGQFFEKFTIADRTQNEINKSNRTVHPKIDDNQSENPKMNNNSYSVATDRS